MVTADGDEAEAAVPATCRSLHRALAACHSRARDPVTREVSCRHLNRSLAECIVSVVCPAEVEAIRALCSSAGTAMKRKQCQQANASLSLCLSAHQAPDPPP